LEGIRHLAPLDQFWIRMPGRCAFQYAGYIFLVLPKRVVTRETRGTAVNIGGQWLIQEQFGWHVIKSLGRATAMNAPDDLALIPGEQNPTQLNSLA
jgi:hypothetical protein